MSRRECPTAGAVRLYRMSVHLTQREAANLVGMDLSNWERIEAGSRVMRARTWDVFLARIEDAKRILALETEVEQLRHMLRLALEPQERVSGRGPSDGIGKGEI